MIIFIALLFIIGDSHLIISVTQSNSTVSATQNVNIRILTSAAINNNTLIINLPTQFDATSPCLVDNTTINCSYSLSTSFRSITFNHPFATNTFYDLKIYVNNPYYSNNFQFTAIAAKTSFTNSGVIGILPKVISCSLVPESQLVGDVTAGYFNINNDIIPPNSIITINSTLQTIFNNLITSSPVCLYQNITLPCSLTTNLQQQYLTITAATTSANMIIQVNSINNPPYNDSFNDIGIQITTSAGNSMQVCNFKQNAVTTLRKSTSFNLLNWNSQIGSQSSVTATLNTFFTPYSNQLLFIYPVNWVYTIQTPASNVLTSTSSISNNYISGATTIGKSLLFSAIVKNPPFVQPLNSTIYVAFSSTRFIEQFTISTYVLTPINIPLNLMINQSRTFYPSTYNISTSMPYDFTTGFTGLIAINYGVINCNNLILTSNYILRVVNCTSTQLYVNSSDTVLIGSLWLSFSMINYHSTIKNQISFSLFGPSPMFYRIGAGISIINLTPNNQSFTIKNTITTFYKYTTIILSQSGIISSSLNRIFILQLPIDLLLFQNTTINNLRSGSTINSFSINLTQLSITINVNGLLHINLSNIMNPIKYNGSLFWTIRSTDSINNPSSLSTATMEPTYTETIFDINMTLTDTTIQNNATMVLTLVPILQYYTPPTIRVTLSNSFILTPCQNCTAISSNMISFIYFAPIMRITLLITNNQHPFGNSIATSISINSFVYETNSLSYLLTPMTYSYTAYQQGLYGTIGSIDIKITKRPTQNVQLTYSNLNIFNNPQCITCTNTQISISGVVNYFQSSIIILTGSKDNYIYAVANVQIKYICQSITDCQICINQTIDKQITLICQQCYNSTFTVNKLLYNNKCIQTCPISTYSNGLTCVSCKQRCYICDNQTCKQCLPNYYIYNNSCLETCPLPLINNATHCINVPFKCPNNCIDCPTSTTCNTCDAKYLLLNNLCYSSCPSGYIAKASICVSFNPPQETKYFPFPFIITAFLLFIVLYSMKCFEKRSLIMGNLIAFVSLVEIGTIIMTLHYTFQGPTDLVTQFLCFVLLFSKVLLNFIFLIYFLKAIATEDQFIQWLENNEDHVKIYKFLIFFSTLFSFQMIRIIYSRLLGLHIFFGKFNTSLIFKPLNYFTIAYFITSGVSLIILSIRNIINQDGYKTSTFFSSIQSIVIEGLLVLICLIDNKKGYDSQFFEYQIYKVYNQFQHQNIEKVEIEQQSENVENMGSMHQIVNSVLPQDSKLKFKKQSSLIKKNNFWAKKIQDPSKVVQNCEVQMDPIEQSNQNIIQQNDENPNKKVSKVGLLQHQKDKITQKMRQNQLRKKIIADWKKMQETLPKKLTQLSKQKILGNKSNIPNQSFSPNHQQIKNSLKRSSSMNETQLKLPEEPHSIPQKIKKHFQSSMNNLTMNNLLPKKQKKNVKKIEQNKKVNQNNNIFNNQSKTVGISLQNQSNNSQNNLLNAYQDHKNYQYDDFQIRNQKIFNSGATNKMNLQDNDFIRYQNRYNEGIHELYPDDNEILEPSDEEQSKQIDINNLNPLNGRQQNKQLQQQQSQMRFHNAEINTDLQNEIIDQPQNKRKYVVNYRYEQGKQPDKQYRVKKRKVNRQTQKIYLQRLLVSDRKSKPLKGKKLQF